MESIEIVRIGPEDWQEFCVVRLAALRNAPGAFKASYDDWVDAAEDRWRQRLVAVPLTLVARGDAVQRAGRFHGPRGAGRLADRRAARAPDAPRRLIEESGTRAVKIALRVRRC